MEAKRIIELIQYNHPTDGLKLIVGKVSEIIPEYTYVCSEWFDPTNKLGKSVGSETKCIKPEWIVSRERLYSTEDVPEILEQIGKSREKQLEKELRILDNL